MVNDELLDKKKLRFWLILDDFMDYFSMVNTIKIPYILSSGFAIALYDLIRRHDVTPNQRGRILKLKGYVQKVSNPLPLPDPAREAHC